MEKSLKEVFNEIHTTIEGLRAQLDELEERVVALAQIPDHVGDDASVAVEDDAPVAVGNDVPVAVEDDALEPEPVEVEPEPVELETQPVEVVPEPVEVIPEPVDVDLPTEDIPAVEPAAEPEPAIEPEPEPAVEPEPAIEPEPTIEPEPVAEPEPEVIDLSIDMAGMGARTVPDAKNYQWMIDLPGGPVANVISAISLNDRVLFINTLFKEDPALFQSTISEFNKMETINEAVSYVIANFPDWNLNSEVVYRLMMAVRRKLK